MLEIGNLACLNLAFSRAILSVMTVLMIWHSSFCSAFAPIPTHPGFQLHVGKISSVSRRFHCNSFGSALFADAQTTPNGESFQSLGLSDDLVGVTGKMGWDYPTPVQKLSIPAILDMAHDDRIDSHNSLWCEAPTGSGKTAGFALPLLQIQLKQKRPGSQVEQRPSAGGLVSTLVLCPTRELAAQTGSVVERMVSNLPKKHRSSISVEVIHGGVPIEPQVARLARKRRSNTNVDILVATPGRLVDVLRNKDRADPTLAALERRVLDAFEEKSAQKKSNSKRGRSGRTASSLSLNDIQEMELDSMDDDGRGSLDEILHKLDYLVLDEADRLLGGAFKDDINNLLSLFPQKDEIEFKSLLFSATFPEQIEERVDRVLSRISPGVPLRVSTSASMLQRVVQGDGNDDNDGLSGQLSHRQEKRIANTTPITAVAPDVAPQITQRVIRVNEKDRTQALRQILGENKEEWDRVLVFVATRYAAEHVTRKLRRYDISAAELHGKLDQDARERRLNSFRTGKTRVLVSTDLAARGIDVEGLPVVINYDLPRAAADFTHRTGRTGRAGKSGTAISFVTAKKESHFNFIEKKELPGQSIEREVLPGFEPDESLWDIESMAEQISVPGAVHSQKGIAHDRMFGGVKGRRKSKKDKLREAAAKAAQEQD